jgi:hypothetical protein
MERQIFHVNNLSIALACVAFAEELELIVEGGVRGRLEEGHYLTTASTNHDVNFIKNESFALKKANEANIDIYEISEYFNDFIINCVNEFESNLETEEDQVSLVDDVAGPDSETVTALYNKVKNQKKSPRKYYVVWKNDQWVASTKEDNAFGNLLDLYSLN